jgi:hypothetical protein
LPHVHKRLDVADMKITINMLSEWFYAGVYIDQLTPHAVQLRGCPGTSRKSSSPGLMEGLV